MKLRNLFSIFLLLLVASSCTIHKRHFSKGYFISWNKAYKSEQSAEQDKPHGQITSKTVDDEVIELEKTEDLQVLDFTHQTVNNEIVTPTLQSIKEVKQNTNSIENIPQSENEKVNKGALNGAILSSLGWVLVILSFLFLKDIIILLAFCCFFIAILSTLTSIRAVKDSGNKKDKQLLIVGLTLEGLLILLGIVSLIFWPIEPNMSISIF
jgi:hypothetical protein